MVYLSDKKVLLFIPNGKGIYGTGICHELESIGAKVTVYDERPSKTTVSKIAIRVVKKLIKPYLYYYFRKIITKHKNENYDYVLVVRGEGLTPYIVQMMRKTYKNAIFILYLWDSLKRNNIVSVFPFFDKKFSFDIKDVRDFPELKMRPLFFLPEYEKISLKNERPIDILFIGTVHTDRYKIIKILLTFIKDFHLTSFFYLYFPSKLLFLRKRITDPAFRQSRISDFKYEMLTSDQAAFYMSKAKASLDVEGPDQTGLTMRTIEVLGAKRKLITTNQTIKLYDFYNENNIMIIDRKLPQLDISFINSPYQDLKEELYKKYSLKGWIEEIFQ